MNLERKRGLPESLFLAALVLGSLLLLYLQRDIGPWNDEWGFLIGRDGLGFDRLLGDHNGHLMVLPILAFKAIGAIDSPGAMLPLSLLSVALSLTVSGLVFVFVRRRENAWFALMAGVLVLFLGTGWEDIVWSFNIGWLGAIAAGLGALLVFESGDAPRNTLWCGLLLLVAVCCGGIGLIFLFGVATYALWSDSRRRALTVVAVPLGLYALWFLVYGLDFKHPYNLAEAPHFVVEMAAAGFGGLVGQGIEWGRAVAVAAVVGVFAALSRAGRVDPRSTVVLAMPPAFWLLTATQRAGWASPDGTRLVYASVVLILLAAAQLTRTAKVNQGGALCLAGVFLIALAGNLAALKHGSDTMRSLYAASQTQLTAIAIAGPRAVRESALDPVDPSLSPDENPGLFALLRRADFATTPEALTRAPNQERTAVDATLFGLTPVTVGSAQGSLRGPVAPDVTAASPGARERRDCLIVPARAGGFAEFRLGRQSLEVKSSWGIELYARRYAESFPPAPQTRIGAGTKLVTVDRGTDSRPWMLRLRSNTGFVACVALRRGGA